MDMRERPYQKLVAWQEAHKLCKLVYHHTVSYPSTEKFGLVTQLRRAASSVATNIAEGNGRRSRGERAHFLEISIGSLEEVHYHCLLSFELGYLKESELIKIDDYIQRVGYLLNKLQQSMR